MVGKVEKIRDDPLYAMRLGDEEFKREEIAKKKQREESKKKKASFKSLCGSRATTHKEPLETVILEKTIIKIGPLLALGFGEAGASIIGQNMKGADTAGVKVMVPGKRVECVLGV